MAIYTPRMRSLGNINSTPFNSVQTARNINPITRVIRNIGNIDAALSPMSIFSSGVDGCWLDPSDMTTLYQDAAGTIPVTAVEQPVGLMLDKSRGMMLGPEKIINGDFSTPANWTLNGASITTGRLDFNTSATQYIAFQDNGLNYFAVGRSYVVELDYSTNVSTNVYIDGNSVGTILAGVGHFKYIYKALSTVNGRLQINTQAAGAGWIDNISVRELYGYHATQSITVSRPTLSARKNILLATETLSTQSVTTLAAQYTLSFTGTGSVTLSGTATGTLTGTGTDRVSLTFTPTAGTLTLTVSGSVVKAQMEFGAAAGPYQRVTTTTNYDTDERYFKKFLRFDGVDDYLNLPYMGLYESGAASVVVGVSSIPIGGESNIIAEASTASASPLYLIEARANISINSGAFIRNDAGSTQINSIASSGEITSNVVVRSMIDSGSNISKYVNSSFSDSDNYTRSGTLTLSNTSIGASLRPTTFGFFNGSFYGSIIVKGAALTDAQRIACERYLGRKSGVTL